MSTQKNILVLTYWRFEDALVQTYTLPYLRIIRDILPAGSKIFLVTLEAEGNKELVEIENGIGRFSFTLHPFGIKAMFTWRKNIGFLTDFCRMMKINFIHTWCSPAGAIGYYVSKRNGLPLILDSYEPHAEPMVETGTWRRGGIAFRTLFALEKKQSRRATWRIGVVSKMRDYAREKYGVDADNFLVKPACIDLELFIRQNKREEIRAQLGLKDDDVVCICAGKFGGLYLEAAAFSIFKGLTAVFGDKLQVLLLTSTPREQIETYCAQVNLDPKIVHSVFVPHHWVPKYMAAADFAFSPFKPVPSRRYCTPIKNGEYWAMGLPVIILKGISDDSEIISASNAGVVMDSVDKEEAMRAGYAMKKLLEGENREELAGRIRALAEKHRNFTIAKEVYTRIYGNL